uniref:lysine--tRNA ligase-like isoform X2 n=1 Tax=Erigeron canadensis TaxID=72917 RepID=UPI001CB901AA|nr:lysine--tRNA ligase-like isoform X2 [Erigeron canadensis]
MNKIRKGEKENPNTRGYSASDWPQMEDSIRNNNSGDVLPTEKIRKGKSMANSKKRVRKGELLANPKKKVRKGINDISSSSSTISVGTAKPWMISIDIELLKEMMRISQEKDVLELQSRIKKPVVPITFEIPILEDDQDLDRFQYHRNRLKTIATRAKRRNLYGTKLCINRTMPISDFIAKYKSLEADTCRKTCQTYLAGRLTSKVYSSDVITYDLVGFGGEIQVKAFPRFAFGVKDNFLELHFDLRVGDYVGVVGFPATSSSGELSIISESIIRLSYCLHKMPPLLPNLKEFDASTPGSGGYPDAYILKDQETCFCRSSQDLTSSEVKVIYDTREKVVSCIRYFLDNLGFLKVDSPILTMVPGGADAHPFGTPYNYLNMKMFMEIAPELYLKQFVVGGKERVYEVGKQFRTDGIDPIRCPEFMCQFYMVLADYEYLMQLTEKMLSCMVKELTGSYKVAYHANGYDNKPIEIDFTPPFRRISMIRELEKMANLNIPKDLASDEARQYLAAACTKFDIKCSPPQSTAILLEKLTRHFLEDTCVNPTFIMEHPDIMSPRAKSLLGKSGLTERFQLFINKFELINSYTEENDPMVHRKRFANQGKDQQSGDGESLLCMALDYGLPPIGGWVLGIDRLTMLLTDSQNIKIGSYTFPTMKPPLHHEHPIKDIVPCEIN